jgi:signal transduction histidine kinase
MPDEPFVSGPEGENSEQAPPPPRKVDILLVDDNPVKIVALESALAPLEENLVTATSGREALRQLLSRDFATVILDVNMPGMDGFETAQLIRGRPRTAHTPIIFVSSINLADTDALRGYSLGAVDYILAPVVPEILRAKVAVFVELHRKTEEARRQAAELEKRTRQLQESQNQLRLAERMAALGTLSAGLGHDMGNLLLPIQARLESLKAEPLSDEVQETMEGIRTCIGYLRRLSSGLRMLSMEPKPIEGTDQTTDVAAWWPDAEPMLRNVLPPNVQLSTSVEENLPRIALAKHLMTQVVFNLVQNAGDALRNTGEGTVSVAIGRGKGGVALAVSDNGPGMSKEVQERCLEPFFTTKPRGISTGLGLALIHAIVDRAGGRLEIRSEPGSGACFTCVFPAVATQPSSATQPVAMITVRDQRQRSLVASLLGMKGVTVLPEADPNEATLWITDPDTDQLELRCRSFLDSKPGRRVLILGDGPSSLNDKVVVLPTNATASQLRQALWYA